MQEMQREPREIFDEAEREARLQEDKQDAEAFRLLSTPACGSGRCSRCDGATSTATAGCCSSAAACRLVSKGCRRAAVPASCLSPCQRFMPSRDSARETISRVLRTMSSSTASVVGSMPLPSGAATSEGAWRRACARFVSTGCARCGQSRRAYLDPVFVRDFLGHRKLSTTDRYVSAKARPESSPVVLRQQLLNSRCSRYTRIWRPPCQPRMITGSA